MQLVDILVFFPARGGELLRTDQDQKLVNAGTVTTLHVNATCPTFCMKQKLLIARITHCREHVPHVACGEDRYVGPACQSIPIYCCGSAHIPPPISIRPMDTMGHFLGHHSSSPGSWGWQARRGRYLDTQISHFLQPTQLLTYTPNRHYGTLRVHLAPQLRRTPSSKGHAPRLRMGGL